MQKKRGSVGGKSVLQNLAFIVATVIGCVLGFEYVDLPDKEEKGCRIFNNITTTGRDTTYVHDTIYKCKTIVRWKYKRSCCCCNSNCQNDNSKRLDSI